MAKKETAKAPNKRKRLPPITLKPRQERFVREYVKNGGNGTKAYLKSHQTNHGGSAATAASKLIRKPHIERAIVTLLDAEGATEINVSKRLSQMLHSDDSWTCNESLKHLRAIRGLDAPKQSHMTVDKRSLNINVSSSDAKSLLSTIIKDS